MKTAWKVCAEKILGKRPMRKTKPWISEEVKSLAEKKKNARKQGRQNEYRTLKYDIQTKLRRDKTQWLEEECMKISIHNEQRKSKEMFNQIRKVKVKTFKPIKCA